jgi:adenine-specific DNA-methyltransferase
MNYPIFVKKDCSDFRIPKMEWNNEIRSFDLLEKPDSTEVISLPIDPTGRIRTWKWSLETVNSAKDTEMGVRLDKDKKPSVYYKGRMKDEDMLPYTVWDKPEYSASSMGTNLLTAMLGTKKFDYPKSLYAVIDSLRVLSADKSATFLDFFAGSGTTGHAVLEMNKQDRGNRQFILCTNNENSIAEEVTYPRVKNVILGYKSGSTQVEGLGGNLKYYKTSFVDRVVTDADRRDFVVHATEMLCLAEETFDEKKLVIGKYAIYSNVSKTTAIIHDEDHISEVREELRSIKGKLIIYVFTYDNVYDGEDFDDLNGDFVIRPIPAVILNVYSRVMRQAARRINL